MHQTDSLSREQHISLKRTAESLQRQCFTSAGIDSLSAVLSQSVDLCVRFPRSPLATQTLSIVSATLTHSLVRHRDTSTFSSHLSHLETLCERHPEFSRRPIYSQIYAQALEIIAHSGLTLDASLRDTILHKSEELLSVHSRNGFVLARCTSAIAALTPQDPDAMARLASHLRAQLDSAPKDTGVSDLVARWASTVSLCTERLLRQKRWSEITPWRDRLRAEYDNTSAKGVLVAFDLARATRCVALSYAATEDLDGLTREVSALDTLRRESVARRDLRRRELTIEWAVAASALANAHGELSWTWGPHSAVATPDAAAHLDHAEEQLVSMWRYMSRMTLARAIELLAVALQDFTWCARAVGDDRREAYWHARLWRLAARRPWSPAETYWALSAASRALTLADRGDLDGAFELATKVCECAARREGAPSREALGKALCAVVIVHCKRGEVTDTDDTDDVLASLEAMANGHTTEGMLLRFYVNAARECITAKLSCGAHGSAWYWIDRVGAVVSLSHGAGLGRRVFAKILHAVAQGDSARAREAQVRLTVLAQENPDDEAIVRLAQSVSV